MKIAVVKVLFSKGNLAKAVLCPNPMGEGWNLVFLDHMRRPETLETDKGETRIFKGINAALNVVEDIGFQELLIETKNKVNTSI